MPTNEALMLLASCRIMHHIPGRLRVKLDIAASGLPTPDQARFLLERLRAVSGIYSVTINVLAASCTVEYDVKLISPEMWNDLFSNLRTEARDDLVARFEATSPASEGRHGP